MAENEHITPEWYYWVAYGQVSPRVLAERLHQHLVTHCDECRAAWEALGDNQRAVRELLASAIARHPGVTAPLASGHPPVSSPSQPPLATEALEYIRPYATAFGKATRRLEEEAAALRNRRLEAHREVRMLLRHPAEDRLRRIDRANRRFRSRALAEALLQESRRLVRSDCEEAIALAELVRPVLLRTPRAVPSDWAFALMFRASAHRANALRVAGQLQSAAAEFDALRADLEREPLADIDLMTELDSLEASLRLDQRRFDDADRLLERAVGLCRKHGMHDDLGALLIQSAVVSRQQGNLHHALAQLAESLQVVDPRRLPTLHLCAMGNKALVLCDQERYSEARAALDEMGNGWRAAEEPWWHLRIAMVEGRIAVGLDDLVTAEQRFRTVLETCQRSGNHYDASLAALDLALVYLVQGRLGDVRRLASEAAPLFHSHQVPREALAALTLLQTAMAAGKVTEPALRQVREHLERARFRPTGMLPS